MAQDRMLPTARHLTKVSDCTEVSHIGVWGKEALNRAWRLPALLDCIAGLGKGRHRFRKCSVG